MSNRNIFASKWCKFGEFRHENIKQGAVASNYPVILKDEAQPWYGTAAKLFLKMDLNLKKKQKKEEVEVFCSFLLVPDRASTHMSQESPLMMRADSLSAEDLDHGVSFSIRYRPSVCNPDYNGLD